MHDVLRTRVLRKLESLPEDQVYQILDYIEFLESKYAQSVSPEASGLQSLAEKLEDQLRRRAVSPSSLREAFQLISAADKVLSNISNVGKELLGEINGSHDAREGRGGERSASSPSGTPSAERRGVAPSGPSGGASPGGGAPSGPRGGSPPGGGSPG
jgi:hypothetical protein